MNPPAVFLEAMLLLSGGIAMGWIVGRAYGRHEGVRVVQAGIAKIRAEFGRFE